MSRNKLDLVWATPQEMRIDALRVMLDIMEHNITTIARAFQLAKSGDVASVSDIKKQLKAEGYRIDQIEGPTLSKQLRLLINTAKATIIG